MSINFIKEVTGASEAHEKETIQLLWSGYGKIMRYELVGASSQTVIIKHIQPPPNSHHPRGWNTNRSHQRKLRSYQVEMSWFETWNTYCDPHCRVPHCLGTYTQGNDALIVLEDLDASGFAGRRTKVTTNEVHACLSWLAHFHATFLGERPQGLWKKGTYWHLDTRPDELKALNDNALKKAAPLIDQTLQQTPFQTFVHGDAKLANFCFSHDGQKVAAVDFQYVGGGCGMKDVAYFLGSCLNENECDAQAPKLLNHYFQVLRKALTHQQKSIDLDALENNWRELYPVAWTDFHRFIKGWSPGHWKINSYSERLAQKVIEQLTPPQ